MISTKEKNYLFSLLKDLGKEAENIKKRKIRYELKEDGSPLTEADNLVNKSLNEFIKKTDYQNIISEENKNIDYIQRESWNWFWLVDPIDGTKEYLNKSNDYTLNVALCFDEYPIFSIVYAPGRNELFYAEKDKGAYKNGVQIHSNQSIEEKINIVASKSHLNKETEAFIVKLSKRYDINVLQYGSSLKICKVAEGIADFYPRYGPTMEWDTAAADLILQEAGGELISVKKQNLKYNKSNLLNPNFLARGLRSQSDDLI